MTIGENIAKRREQLGMTQEQLADLLGYKHKSSISKIEKGINDVTQTKLVQIAEILHTTVDYLLDGDSQREPSITTEFVTFQIIGEVAAGYGHEAYTDDYGKIDVPASWLHGRPQSDYFVLKITGDSMFPTYQDGDLILVLRQTTLNYSGQVGVVSYEDDRATLKRIEFVYGEDWMRLVPINPNFPPQLITNEDLEHCRVLGLPKMVIREINQ